MTGQTFSPQAAGEGCQPRQQAPRLPCSRAPAAAAAPSSRQSCRGGRRQGPAACQATQQRERGRTAAEAAPDSLQIEGLAADYCDEFVCTSSPAVEQTLRAMARDLTRMRSWTLSRFDANVEYKDPFRSFTGVEKYERLNYYSDCLGNPKVLVTAMRMAGRDRGVVTWRLRAGVGLSQLDVTATSTFTLNLLTGRVVRHEEEYDLSRCSAGAKAAWRATRALWSASQASQDATETGRKALGRLTEKDEPPLYGDPGDPTKFFQQDDPTMRDAFTLATFLAIGYLFVQAYIQLDRLDHL